MGTNNLGKKLRCKNLEKSVAEGNNSMQRNISELLEGKAKKKRRSMPSHRKAVGSKWLVRVKIINIILNNYILI